MTVIKNNNDKNNDSGNKENDNENNFVEKKLKNIFMKIVKRMMIFSFLFF